MTIQDLKEEVGLELELMEVVIEELSALSKDVGPGEPTLRDKTAAGGFLAQFYNGVENILKRISHYHRIALPIGDTWHIELFKRFCSPSYTPLPELFDETLAAELAPYRRFRHVVHHGYGSQLSWDHMVDGVKGAGTAFSHFKSRVKDYIETLKAPLSSEP